MRLNLGYKALAAAVALAAASGAFANTSLDVPNPGSIYLNVYDSAAAQSFVFDTGLTQSTFNAANNYSFSFAGDPNWAAFVAGEKAGDTIQYSVVAGSKTSSSSLTFSTAQNRPSIAPGQNKITSAATAIGQYAQGVNLVTSSTNTTSLTTGGTLSTPSYYGSVQPTWASSLTITDLAVAGNSIGFFSFLATSPRSTSAGTTAAFDGSWLLNGTSLTWTSTIPTPLTAPWVLLLSAVALMGVIARRGKFDSSTGMPELTA